MELNDHLQKILFHLLLLREQGSEHLGPQYSGWCNKTREVIESSFMNFTMNRKH